MHIHAISISYGIMAQFAYECVSEHFDNRYWEFYRDGKWTYSFISGSNDTRALIKLYKYYHYNRDNIDPRYTPRCANVVKDKIHLFNSIPIPSQYYMHTIEYEDETCEDGEVCSIPNLIYKLNIPPYFKKQYMGIWLD